MSEGPAESGGWEVVGAKKQAKQAKQAAAAAAKAVASTIMFVCTSNTCRSPMAEAIGRRWLCRRAGLPDDGGAALAGAGVVVCSGGLLPDWEPHGSPASANGATAMADPAREGGGYDLSAHRSNLRTDEELRQAARVYCVTGTHRDRILARVEGIDAARVVTLGENVPDPWHQPLPQYVSAADALGRLVPAVLERDWEAELRPLFRAPPPSE